ncbi:hypothetical protein Hanom_Chr08g00720381 [Helianthus anomalus]
MVLMNNLTILWILYYSLTLDKLGGSLERNESSGLKTRESMIECKVSKTYTLIVKMSFDDKYLLKRTETGQTSKNMFLYKYLLTRTEIGQTSKNMLFFI